MTRALARFWKESEYSLLTNISSSKCEEEACSLCRFYSLENQGYSDMHHGFVCLRTTFSCVKQPIVQPEALRARHVLIGALQGVISVPNVLVLMPRDRPVFCLCDRLLQADLTIHIFIVSMNVLEVEHLKNEDMNIGENTWDRSDTLFGKEYLNTNFNTHFTPTFEVQVANQGIENPCSCTNVPGDRRIAKKGNSSSFKLLETFVLGAKFDCDIWHKISSSHEKQVWYLQLELVSLLGSTLAIHSQSRCVASTSPLPSTL